MSHGDVLRNNWWKVSVFEVILFRIFAHSYWITPNTDAFYIVRAMLTQRDIIERNSLVISLRFWTQMLAFHLNKQQFSRKIVMKSCVKIIGKNLRWHSFLIWCLHHYYKKGNIAGVSHEGNIFSEEIFYGTSAISCFRI